MSGRDERIWMWVILGGFMASFALFIGINTANAQREADQREDQIVLMCADMIVAEHGIDLAEALSFCQEQGENER